MRRFCSVCGTHIVAERSDQPHVVLRVATLDDDPDAKPIMHIWTSHEVPWLTEDERMPRFPEWPPAR
jgi:ADP-ribosyl-[dinitrogen reductase] hydrolase